MKISLFKKKKNKIVIFGSGGISREIAFLIEDINKSCRSIQFEILGFIEKDKSRLGCEISGYKILGDYSILNHIKCDGYVLPMGNPIIKKKIYNEEIAKIDKYLKAFNIIHPSVVFREKYVKLGIGNIICAGTILTSDILLGDFNLINLNCTIGHDVEIGNFNVINPLSAISGNVRIGNNNLIGTGSKVIQNLA